MLKVEINSFSYKTGILNDKSANREGFFIFDCRGILNPGRFKLYEKLSGKDKEVQEFLMKKNLFIKFIESVKTIIKISLDDYINRNLNCLQINFGCTGGQHRSVFSAELVKQFVEKNYPNTLISITHTNQKNWTC